MYFLHGTKSAAHYLGIVVRAALALALAIGASGAILSAGGLRPTPFLCVEIADAATAEVDLTDPAMLLDEHNTEANSQPDVRILDYIGEARSTGPEGVMLSISYFIPPRRLSDNGGRGESASIAWQHGF
jgi:hypothetical protein